MAIEQADMHVREVWSNVARAWYNNAADRSPDTGRIQHHLAVLARPNIVQQLFYYSKSLVSVQPFENARESIMLLFNPLLDPVNTSHYDKYPLVEASFVTASAVLFKRVSIQACETQIQRFIPGLGQHIFRVGSKWTTQGPEVAASLFAACFDFGNGENPLWLYFKQHMDKVQTRRTIKKAKDPSQLDVKASDIRDELFIEFWTELNSTEMAIPRAPTSMANQTPTSEGATVLMLKALKSVTAINADKIGDRNIVPYMSFVLSFVWALARVGHPLIYLEAQIPWSSLVLFLNTLDRSSISEERIHRATFPESNSGRGQQLPEDFLARGAIWAQHIFPADFFCHNVSDEDERAFELPSHAATRLERCLWLGLRLVSLDRYVIYNPSTKIFSVTAHAALLEQNVRREKSLTPVASDVLSKTSGPPIAEGLSKDVLDADAEGSETDETDSGFLLIPKELAII